MVSVWLFKMILIIMPLMAQNSMKKRSFTWLSCLSLFSSLILAGQVLLIVIRGEAFCLNEGCRVVEGLTLVSPFVFNIIGLVYFQMIFWISLASKSKSGAERLLRFVLIAGLIAEGVLLSYQTVVAGSFCSYCLFIFFMVTVLNALMDFRQMAFGLLMVAVQMGVFSLLKFDSPEDRLHGLTLDDGTYAVRSCSDPIKHLYLIFSEDCPHCHNVIEMLEGCTRCEFHFNPIEAIDRELLPGLSPNEKYSTEINILALKILGIDTIPILMAKDHDGFTFIKGQRNITNYIQKTCFEDSPLVDEDMLDAFEIEDGACSIMAPEP